LFAGTAAHLVDADWFEWIPMLCFCLVYGVTVGRVVVSLREVPVLRRNLRRREHDALPPAIAWTAETATAAHDDIASGAEPAAGRGAQASSAVASTQRDVTESK
jgi:hypothetical protein